MKPLRPKFIDDYYLTQGAREPECCYTCFHYTEKGQCEKFEATPPPDFAATIGGCESWETEIPF